MATAEIFYDRDIEYRLLKDKVVAVIGYGSQGKAQAQNLRDSGIKVVMGLRPEGKSWSQAKDDGFEVLRISDAVEAADVIMMLIPDMAQPAVYESEVAPKLSEGKALDFAHGFNIHYGLIKPPSYVDVFMVAPKGPGRLVRETYLSGFGVPALIAVHQNYTGNAKQLALEVAKAIGCARAGVLTTTFKDETESDLIGEQTVLVGGLMELIRKGFEVLVEEGYPSELAFFEACNEVKLIADLIYEGGISGMLNAVSETARYGGLTVGPKVIDESVKERMREAARAVKSGEFAKEWLEEYRRGCPRMKELMEAVASHKLEEVGERMRRLARGGG